MTVARLDPGDRRRMVAAGRLSPFVDVAPFSPVEAYEAAAGDRIASDDDPPALGVRRKASGHPNFNHRAYVEISSTLARDSLVVISSQPQAYARAVGTAVRRFFSSCVAYPPFADNLYVVFPLFRLGEATWNRPSVAVFVYLLGVVGAATSWRRGRRLHDDGLVAVSAFALLTLLWTFAVGCLVEVGENHRFRATMLPLVWVMVVAWATSRRRAEWV